MNVRMIRWSVGLVLILAAVPVWAGEAPARKLRAVLWTGGGAHDYKAITEILTADLPKLLPVELQVVQDGSFLDSPEAGKLDVILMNHCFGKCPGVLTEPQQKKLLDAVRGGLGVVAVHCSYWSFGEWPEFHDLFGARFTVHGRNGKITVAIVDRGHPITKDLPPSFDVTCELYRSTPLAQDCHVLARARAEGSTEEFPTVWTKTFGQGRVVAILPAHAVESFRVPEFQKLITASMTWAAQKQGKP